MSGVEQALRNKFGEFGVDPDRTKAAFASPLGQFALEVAKALGRLQTALILCHEAAERDGRTDEVNAAKLFLDTVRAASGHDAFALIAILERLCTSVFGDRASKGG